MPEITEIFVVTLKNAAQADAIREAARHDFLSIEGVESWRTFVSTDPERQTLFAEVYTFPNHETAKRVSPLFATRTATKAFLNEIDEILVGQYFREHTFKGA